MKGPKKQSRRAEPSLRVHRLLEGEQLVLTDSDTLLLVVRGACTVHGRAREPERIEAGALLSRQSQVKVGVDRAVARRAIGRPSCYTQSVVRGRSECLPSLRSLVRR